METNLPKDPYMLLSFINTQLRDKFATLEACCEYYGIEATQLKEKLAALDYQYDEGLNRFV